MTTTSEYSERTYPETQPLDLFNLPVSQAARDKVARVLDMSESYKAAVAANDYQRWRAHRVAGMEVQIQSLLFDHFEGFHRIEDPEVLMRIECAYLYSLSPK